MPENDYIHFAMAQIALADLAMELLYLASIGLH